MSGGFLPVAPSPSFSVATNASTITPSRLPRQRTHPLKPGSMKETALINHVDAQMLRINRRHAKKYSRNIDEHTDEGNAEEGDDVSGYEGFGEVVRDIERVIDVVWVSGTRQFPLFQTVEKKKTKLKKNKSCPANPIFNLGGRLGQHISSRLPLCTQIDIPSTTQTRLGFY